MAPERNVTTGFYPAPYSLPELIQDERAGLIVLGALGMLSVTALLPVIVFIAARFLSVQNLQLNQPIVLCFNLLLADLFQATSFLASFHWVVVGGIFAPSGWCHVQGALLNIGDLTSGFFVLFIALHTAYTITSGKTISRKVFAGITIFIWVFALVLTLIGPIIYGESFFVLAGNWCWISPAHETERLVCHYLWTFINEFGTVVVYVLLFVYLHRKMERLRRVNPDIEATKSINRATRYMILYPVVFVIATLPLAVGRMCSAASTSLPNQYFIGAGALLASCGWLDAVLYTVTRRVLLKNGQGGSSGSSYPYVTSGLGQRTTWISSGTAPDRYSSTPGTFGHHGAGMSNMTLETEGKSATVPTIREEDELELLDRPRSLARSPSPFLASNSDAASSAHRSTDSSGHIPAQGMWPLPPMTSPTPEDQHLPVPKRTMVRIEEEPGPGRAPRKYWRMEPSSSSSDY